MLTDKKVRLQKYIAECGFASRRKSEELITSGKVKVNGQTIIQLGTKITPHEDKVMVNGKIINLQKERVYYKVNKPIGYVSSCRKFKEKTVLDLIHSSNERLFPIGRLDKNTEGLVILTNDGALAYQLMHPKYKHEKEYLVKLDLPLTQVEIDKLKNGIFLHGYKTQPITIKTIMPSVYQLTLTEGKKRQIREMMRKVGKKTLQLKRIRIKNILLDNLKSGEFARLTKAEVEGLKS